ncbi:hypothetical protein FAVG1_08615 [Fusarium avenaceum]|nr:hypothetical protein FAVG1_08615 [Fusarium avenaceum]
MSLDRTVQIWLSNVEQSTNDPSPTPEPYADVPPNAMKRRRADSPPRETRQKLKLSPNDPLYDLKKSCLQRQAEIDMLKEELDRITFQARKKRATGSNQVSSELQQKYCNFISYSTGKVERRLISRIVHPVPQPATTESRTPSSSDWAQVPRSQDVKVEPDTEPISWPRDVNAEPVARPGPIPLVQRTWPKANFTPQPPALPILLKRINDIYAGRGILPTDFRPIVNATTGTPLEYKLTWARGGAQSDVHYCDKRHIFGKVPDLKSVAKVMDQSNECTGGQALPNEWNMEVVHKVLELSYRDEPWPLFLDFRCSDNGIIIPDYHTNPDNPPPPDFCVYVETPLDGMLPDCIDDMQKRLVRKTFNHIDLKSLQSRRPIAFHVHTLSQNTDRELQRVRTAFAAHWGLLKRMMRMREKIDMEWPNQAFNFMIENPYNLPEFLPGIIIHKQNWFLSISKYGEDNPRFYAIGNTESSIGVYKIVYVLQVLKKWAKTEYWDWIRNLLVLWPSNRDGRKRW